MNNAMTIENMTPEQIAAFENLTGQKPPTKARINAIGAAENQRQIRVREDVEFATSAMTFCPDPDEAQFWRPEITERDLNDAIWRDQLRRNPGSFFVGMMDETGSIMTTAIIPSRFENRPGRPINPNGATISHPLHLAEPVVDESTDDERREYANEKMVAASMNYREAVAFRKALIDGTIGGVSGRRLKIGFRFEFVIQIAEPMPYSSRQGRVAFAGHYVVRDNKEFRVEWVEGPKIKMIGYPTTKKHIIATIHDDRPESHRGQR